MVWRLRFGEAVQYVVLSFQYLVYFHISLCFDAKLLLDLRFEIGQLMLPVDFVIRAHLVWLHEQLDLEIQIL